MIEPYRSLTMYIETNQLLSHQDLALLTSWMLMRATEQLYWKTHRQWWMANGMLNENWSASCYIHCTCTCTCTKHKLQTDASMTWTCRHWHGVIMRYLIVYVWSIKQLYDINLRVLVESFMFHALSCHFLKRYQNLYVKTYDVWHCFLPVAIR